jgi:hypothetical protein
MARPIIIEVNGRIILKKKLNYTKEKNNMRTLASIQKITNIREIKGADKIAVAEVLGWEVVIRKEEFKIGDLCIYIEVDSIVPERKEFEFLKERKYRVRTIKLRGQLSQGLCLPLNDCFGLGSLIIEGTDVTEKLGIIKYDPEAVKEQRLLDQLNTTKKSRIEKFLLRNKWYRRFFTKEKSKGWPKFIKKTDEERIQKLPWICETEKDTIFTATEKLDGQSATYALLRIKRWWWKDKFKFIVCSRNIHLKKPDNSSYWTIAKQYNIEQILKKLILSNDEYIILQGEIIGEGIQKNKYEIKGYDFYAFNFIHTYLKLNDFEMRYYLSQQNIKCVSLLSNNFILDSDIHKCIELAKGYSSLNYKTYREGMVVRNYTKDISFKVINPDFLIKYQDEEEN